MIAESENKVNSNLSERQYFFFDIKREGKILFDTGNYKLKEPPKELTPAIRREVAEKDFNYWFGTAKKILYSMREDYRLAAFDLQQVVEMCYTAIEMVFTHYNPYEHNIETLRAGVIKFDSRLEEVLPYKTEEQKKLFDYLNFAYIGGRYRSEEEFPITKEQLDYWSKEAQKLLDLTEEICRDKIEYFKKIEKNGRL